jgi:hypothetical protein
MHFGGYSSENESWTETAFGLPIQRPLHLGIESKPKAWTCQQER